MGTDILVYPNTDLIKQLEEDSEKFEHLLSLFQNWLLYQTHLPQHFSKTMLAHFLRSCKMDLEKAKKKFEIFCYLPQTNKKLYTNRVVTLEHDMQCLDYVYACPLPEITSEGYRISMVKPMDMEKCDMLSLFRTATMIADYRLYKEVFITGEILICDYEHAGPQFYGKMFTPMLFRILRIAIDAYPTRVKKVFILSCHPLLEKGINLCKSVLPEKIRDRFHILHNVDDLCKYIPKKYLPSDYNGERESLAVLTKKWKETMITSVDFFKETSDAKPLGPVPKHIPVYDDSLGIDGSFRKLNID